MTDPLPSEPSSAPLQYQLRVYLADELVEVARRDRSDPALRPLADVLARHDAELVSQFDAFEGYVAEAEREGVHLYPLYKWTKATVDDPNMRKKHLGTFAVHVAGQEVYSRSVADGLEAELRPLAGGPVVARMTRHDTNPANNPQMPEQYRS